MNKMTLKDINQKISELKNLNFAEHSNDNYQEYLAKAKPVLQGARSTVISPYYTDSFSVFRARKSSSEKVFHNLGEVWHPTVWDATAQRMNFPHKPLFYCGTDINTSLIEVRPKLNDYVTMIEIGIKCPEMKAIQLVPEKLGDTIENMKPIKGASFQFVLDEIRKDVPDNHNQGYYATQIYTQSLIDSMDDDAFDAIAYNSVAAGLKGYNFVIKPDFIEKNFLFKSATVFKVIEHKGKQDFKVGCLLKATELSNYGRMKFKQLDYCPTHHISMNNFNH